MRRLLFLTLLASLSFGSLSRLESQTQELRLTVAMDGKLVVKPEYLYIDPNHPAKITVKSVVKPICNVQGIALQPLEENSTAADPYVINCQSDSGSETAPHLELRLGSLRGTVELRVLGEFGFQLVPLLPWIFVLLAFFTAIISLTHWSYRPRKTFEFNWRQERAKSDLQRFPDWVSRLTEALSEPLAVGPGKRSSTVLSAPVVSTQSGQIPLKRRIDSFRIVADAWCAVVNTRPQPIEDELLELAALRETTTVDRNARDWPVFLRSARTVALLAVSHCDNYVDREFQNGLVQHALESLVSAAGFMLIYPQPGHRFDEQIHKIVGQDPAPSPQQHGRISRVILRGLRNEQFICKAEVRVYDSSRGLQGGL